MSEVPDTTIMPFGEYRGEKLANVPASKLLYYYDEGYLKYGTIKQYVQENEELLRKEVKDAREKRQNKNRNS